MADGKGGDGGQTFEQHVRELVDAGLITQETARAALALTASAPATPKRGKQGAR